MSYLHQRGITLITGMIMLILVTLMVISAVTLNKASLTSVANTQFRKVGTPNARFDRWLKGAKNGVDT